MTFGIIGSGSWATALAKILTDNGNNIHWWIRNPTTIDFIHRRHHNPHYCSGATFNVDQLRLSGNIASVVEGCDVVLIAVPSAYLEATMLLLPLSLLRGKKILSAVKGILPSSNQFLNDWLAEKFNWQLSDYFTLLGPCHAEEVVMEKLSYLTFSGIDKITTEAIASHFKTAYIYVSTNEDVVGVQYTATLKNIYALGAGIAHGLEYGDNFLSVYIANCAWEMSTFLHTHINCETKPLSSLASVYLGDLLVTCYSPHSRNRTFGNMIGKGYSVTAAQLELNMVAEGYNVSRCMHNISKQEGINLPIAEMIYQILWQHVPAQEGFARIEKMLI